MDDSDAEHAYLREKRMRRPARLWRTARERAVWLRMTRDARSADQTAYAAYIMCDRAGPMLQRVVQLREEIAKWEAEEKERQRLEEMRAKRQAAGVPSLRPLMIRTGKAKTDGAAPLCCCATSCRLRSGARHRLQSPCAAATPPPQPPPPACRRRAHCAQGDGQGAVWQRAQLHL
jgi:hypothetical protein